MTWLAVALGGAGGAMARYAIALYFAPQSNKFPVATLIANIAGSLLMGIFYVLIVEKAMLPAVSRQVLMVGFLGAFTTFSSFSIEALLLMQRGQWLLGSIYICSSVFACIIAAFIGAQLTQSMLRI